MKRLLAGSGSGQGFRRYLPVILAGMLTIGWILLIFMFSLQNGEESSTASSELTHTILYILGELGIASVCNLTGEEFTRAESIIRTLAHFSEFLILGILIKILSGHIIRLYNLVSKSGIRLFLLLSAVCLAVAAADEVIQLGSPGRAFQFLDMAVDLSGACIGMLTAGLLSARPVRSKSAKHPA
ncbi:MAG: VanZ family protein [Saccharofermentanales bacterium]